MRQRLLVLVWVVLGPVALFAQGYSGPPTLRVFAATGLSLPYTVGTVTVGGFQQNINAGSVTVADNQSDCTAPQFVSCNLIYWPGSGVTLLSTTLPLTAFASGNVVVGYVTSANAVVVAVVTPNLTLSLPAGIALPTVGLRLPICNSLIMQGCQAGTKTLSGY